MDGRWELDEEILGGYSILLSPYTLWVVQAESYQSDCRLKSETRRTLNVYLSIYTLSTMQTILSGISRKHNTL